MYILKSTSMTNYFNEEVGYYFNIKKYFVLKVEFRPPLPTAYDFYF